MNSNKIELVMAYLIEYHMNIMDKTIKNSTSYSDDMINLQYDLDTDFGMPNFITSNDIRTIEESYRYEEFTKDAFSYIKSCVGNSPRGEWYKYASLFRGKIVAIGEEQGNYAGGELISIECNTKDEVKSYIKNMATGDEYAQDLYKKIYNLEIADLKEVQAFKNAALDYAHTKK